MRTYGQGEPKDLKAALSVLEEIGRNERHFNSLQSEYRKLASTWLLAALGAIGYILLSSATPSTQASILFLIATGSLLGIAVLWLLDVHVYHRLLESAFSLALQVEGENPSLPPLHDAMLQGMGDRFVTHSICWYYIALASAAPIALLVLQIRCLSNLQQALLAALPILFALVTYLQRGVQRREA